MYICQVTTSPCHETRSDIAAILPHVSKLIQLALKRQLNDMHTGCAACKGHDKVHHLSLLTYCQFNVNVCNQGRENISSDPESSC